MNVRHIARPAGIGACCRAASIVETSRLPDTGDFCESEHAFFRTGQWIILRGKGPFFPLPVRLTLRGDREWRKVLVG